MYYRIAIDANAVDEMVGTFYYNDKSPAFITVDKFKATALTEEEVISFKNSIEDKFITTLKVLTDKDGFFDRRIVPISISLDYKLAFILIITTLNNIIDTNIKYGNDACDVNFILEIARLNNYWLREEEFEIIDMNAIFDNIFSNMEIV